MKRRIKLWLLRKPQRSDSFFTCLRYNVRLFWKCHYAAMHPKPSGEPWTEEDPRMLREQIRVADVAYQHLHEEKTAFIEQLINYTDQAADDMEGADWEEFIKAETRMCTGIDVLKLLGIKYDPMTGKREPA